MKWREAKAAKEETRGSKIRKGESRSKEDMERWKIKKWGADITISTEQFIRTYKIMREKMRKWRN